MKIKEFASIYCADIIERSIRQSEAFDLTQFSYDEIITEDDGTKVPVIFTPAHQIPIMDILSLSRVDFAKIWPEESSLAAYDRYVDGLIILEGPDVLNAVRNELQKEQERVSMYSAMLPEFL